jgi:hypothetical protein
MRLRIDSAPRSSETGLASPHLCLGRHHNGDAGNETIPNETDSEPRERAVPARIHPPRAKRAAPGTDTSVPPHCRPISPTHRSRGRRCLSPAPEATARAERPEPSPATCSFATLHRLPDAHHLRSLPETRCSPALAQELCLFPPFLSASAAAPRPRASTAHSGRNSAEFRRPVRVSESASNGFRAANEAGRRPAGVSGPGGQRLGSHTQTGFSAARASGPCANPSAAREAGRAGD